MRDPRDAAALAEHAAHLVALGTDVLLEAHGEDCQWCHDRFVDHGCAVAVEHGKLCPSCSADARDLRAEAEFQRCRP